MMKSLEGARMSAIIDKFKLNSYKALPILNLPEYLNEELKSITPAPLLTKQEAVLVFTTSNADFFQQLESLVKQDVLEDKGVLLICYPKKGNPRYPSTVHRDEIFVKVGMNNDGFIYGSSYMFNRMLAFDETFTLLEVKKLLNFKPGSRPSQSGADFIKYIPDIEGLLKDEPLALRFYQGLTPGYRKDWAVHVFSTENPDTRNKRISEMIKLLKEGHKNMTLYRQSLKK
jgi:hypothetical protein